MKNWKTTLSGYLALVFAALPLYFPHYAPLWTALMGVAAALGLYHAADAKAEK